MSAIAAHAALEVAPDLLDSIRGRIAALHLDLDGLNVVTEAATGAYACTAVIAALAGARVTALARNSARHGSVRDAASATLGLARQSGVGDRIELIEALEHRHLATCDILTNSGHLRPITRGMVELLPPCAVIALMFEAWEFRDADIDLAACRELNIPVAAVNECHPDVAVFPFLGALAVRLLADSGLPPVGRHIALVCDNPFAPFIRAGLEAAGAKVALYANPDLPATSWDAVVLALDPARNPPLDAAALARLARAAPGTLLAQFWGDVDRNAAERTGLAVAPAVAPAPGHMGILLNALGDDPIVRLQAGGLRAAELVYRGIWPEPSGVAELL